MLQLNATEFPTSLQEWTCHRRLAPGQLLFQQGGAATHLYWVVSGRLRLLSFIEIAHYFVEAGELFAKTALYFDTYACTVQAETAAEAIAIPTER